MTERLRIRFATNRNPISGAAIFGPNFRDGDPKRYVTGSVDMLRLSGLPDSGWEPDRATLQVDAPIDAGKAAPGPQGANDLVAFAAPLPAAAAAGAGTYGLILLPGFAATFVDTLRRAAQIAQQYRAAEVFCFSWPANGKVDRENYRLDQVDARKSGPAIAHALRQLVSHLDGLPPAGRPTLHVVAHSMGNLALRHAIQKIRTGVPALLAKPLFEGALLMAADEADDTLSDAAALGPLVGLAKRVTVYRNAGDGALTVSAVVNRAPRLGQWGPRRLKTLPKSVTSIDCSDVSSTQGDRGETHFGHQYYRLSPWVINDAVQVLRGTPPDQVGGRLRDTVDDADGRAWWIPYGTAAGVATLKRAGTVALTAAAAPRARRAGKAAKAGRRRVAKGAARKK